MRLKSEGLSHGLKTVHRTSAFYCSSPKYKNNPNPSPAEIRFGLSCLGTPEGTRTPNPRNRNPMLYPLSHWRICLQRKYYSRKTSVCKEADQNNLRGGPGQTPHGAGFPHVNVFWMIITEIFHYSYKIPFWHGLFLHHVIYFLFITQKNAAGIATERCQLS